MKYLRKKIGEMDILPKKPLFEQDLEYILDSTGMLRQQHYNVSN